MWRDDMRANGGREGFTGALITWIRDCGFAVITLHLAAARFRTRGIFGKWVSILLSRRIATVYGCYISPLAVIGSGLRLPHPIGIVIGEGVVIGRNVTIFQSVTVGVTSAGALQYPRIGDDVVIYAGAVIIGPVVIGQGASIGANAVVNTDVPAGCMAVGVPARVISTRDR